MRILFDQGTPVPLRHVLAVHQIETVFERGWHSLENGELLSAAEADGFDALITTDQNLRHQQDLTSRRLAIVVLLTTNWRLIRQYPELVESSVAPLTPGTYLELAFPPRAP